MRILQAAPSRRDKLLISLMYATGVRVSEVARLKWEDFDFERKLIHVRQAPKEDHIGHMRIEMNLDRPRGASATVIIYGQYEPVRLPGIVIRETRRDGWLSVDLPSLEDWAGALNRLPQKVEERITGHEFYELLQKCLTQRYIREKDAAQ